MGSPSSPSPRRPGSGCRAPDRCSRRRSAARGACRRSSRAGAPACRSRPGRRATGASDPGGARRRPRCRAPAPGSPPGRVPPVPPPRGGRSRARVPRWCGGAALLSGRWCGRRVGCVVGGKHGMGYGSGRCTCTRGRARRGVRVVLVGRVAVRCVRRRGSSRSRSRPPSGSGLRRRLRRRLTGRVRKLVPTRQGRQVIRGPRLDETRHVPTTLAEALHRPFDGHRPLVELPVDLGLVGMELGARLLLNLREVLAQVADGEVAAEDRRQGDERQAERTPEMMRIPVRGGVLS